MNPKSTYHQELLRKYIDKTITSEERHLLEKMALDDPFLFDAMEGLHPEKEKSLDDILELYQSINSEPNKQRRIIPWRWMSIAAGIILIAAIGFLIRPTQDSALNQTMAKTSSESSIPENEQLSDDQLEYAENQDLIAATLENTVEEANDFEQDGIKKTTSQTNRTDDLRTTQSEEETKILPTKNVSDLASNSAGLNEEDEIKSTEEAEVSVTGSRSGGTDIYIDGVRISPSAIPPQAESASAEKPMENPVVEKKESAELQEMPANAVLQNKAKRKASEPQIDSDFDSSTNDEKAIATIEIKGRVLDETGLPLIGANVINLESNDGTVTDIDGEFTFQVPQDAGMVIISYTGYASKNIVLDGSPSYEIIMEEGALLDEIVVTNVGTKVHRNSLFNSRPIRGFDLFEEYVKDNIILPEGCEGGYVHLSFTINVDGELENIKVVNASYAACESEAIRLLENGGKWVTTPTRQTVDIQYSIEMRY